jgi:hypothetical protein
MHAMDDAADAVTERIWARDFRTIVRGKIEELRAKPGRLSLFDLANITMMKEVLRSLGKARRVWKAAFPEAEQLDDETAIKLGKDLAEAVDWYIGAKSRRPVREHERFRSVENTVGKCLSLLKDKKTISRIEEFFVFDFVWLANMSQGLAAFRKAAARAQKHRGGAAELCKAFHSPEQLFINRLGKAYSEHSKRLPRRSLVDDKENPSNVQRTIGGPFVRFVKEAARQFDIPPPSGETIRLFVEEENRRRGAATANRAGEPDKPPHG